ncbi:MAG: polysaccharide biosynthesis C-terminal domain-containing protein, partial [Firmicutes bacterium]|nr:polysaccharide biosynthesis C-terminal domain-containing protein [Bacillota bacterium]
VSLTYIKPALSAVCMGVAVWGGYKVMFNVLDSNSISTVISVGIGVVVYVVLMFAMGAITDEELLLLPKGRKLAALMAKFRRNK